MSKTPSGGHFWNTKINGGVDYTEMGMNGFSEKQTAETFKRKEYRFLVVAEKFQTGFDQPLLHTMYVDRKLAGVHAVQTLSRLNRVVNPGKEETMVLDFANEADDIKKAFEPYYDLVLLQEATDPHVLYDLQDGLASFHFYTEAEINRFAELYFGKRSTQDKLHAALASVIDFYKDASKEERADFKRKLTDYVRLYAFLSQVINFVDPDLEKLYIFGRFLLRKLPPTGDTLPVEVQRNIDMDSYTQKKTFSGKIKLERGIRELEAICPKGSHLQPGADPEALSKIIHELNERFGTDFTEDDKVFLKHLEERLAEDAGLEASVKVNPPENARLTFDQVLDDRVQEMIDANFKFYKQINDDPEFGKFFSDWLFDRYLHSKQTNVEPAGHP